MAREAPQWLSAILYTTANEWWYTYTIALVPTYSILPVKELSDVTEEHGYQVLQLDSV